MSKPRLKTMYPSRLCSPTRIHHSQSFLNILTFSHVSSTVLHSSSRFINSSHEAPTAIIPHSEHIAALDLPTSQIENNRLSITIMSTCQSHQGAGRHTKDQNMGIADELMNMVDEHLAWHTEPTSEQPSREWDNRSLVNEYQAWQQESEKRMARCDSLGTLCVDYDFETEEIKAFHRRYEESIISDRISTKAPSRTNIFTITPRVESSSSRSQARKRHSTAGKQVASETPRPSKYRNDRDRLPSPATVPSRYDSVLASESSSSSRHVSTASKQRRSPETKTTSASCPRALSTTNYHRKPKPTSTAISAHYSPHSYTVRGHDPSTDYTYDYNGRIVHIRNSSPASPVSEYFDIPAEDYSSNKPLSVTETPLSALPAKAKVVSFVKTLLRKLDSSGILGRMRKEREVRRKRETWVKGGYVT